MNLPGTQNKNTNVVAPIPFHRDNIAVRVSSIAGESGKLVLRVGGNVLTPRGGGYVVDYAVVDAVADVAIDASETGIKLVVLPGGAGGNLFLDWARAARCTDALMNEIGCQLVDLSATIIADYLHRILGMNNIRCAPCPAKGVGDLKTLLRDNVVTIASSAFSGAISSDSLALLIGEAIGAPIVTVKQAVPFPSLAVTTESRSRDHTHWIRLKDLHNTIDQDLPKPRTGFHPPLDYWALHLLRREDLRLFITTGSDLTNYRSLGGLSHVTKVVPG